MSLSYRTASSRRERGKQGVEGRNSGALREGLRVEFENNEWVEGDKSPSQGEIFFEKCNSSFLEYQPHLPSH